MIHETGETPIACDPTAIPPERRQAHGARTEVLAASVLEHRRVEGAIVLRFHAHAVDDLDSFVVDERRCCPFLGFEIVPLHDRESVELRVSGTDAGLEIFERSFDGMEERG